MGLAFIFNDAATTEICALSLHDALPIYRAVQLRAERVAGGGPGLAGTKLSHGAVLRGGEAVFGGSGRLEDRKSKRLFSHANKSYAGFCLKKKKPLTSCTRLYIPSLPPRC